MLQRHALIVTEKTLSKTRMILPLFPGAADFLGIVAAP
jgi:hypothetical protein